MRITELFDNNHDWEQYYNGHDGEFYRFNVSNVRYIVTFEPDGTYADWEVAFARGENLDHHITGTGDQYPVFSTVIDIILHFKKKHHEDSIVFTAKEQSRKRLYKRMTHTLGTKYNMLIKIIEWSPYTYYWIK